MDIFYCEDVKSLLLNKFVVIIGDSIQRGIYKDLVLLIQENRYLKEKEMRDKGEYTFLKDELIEGGRKGEMTNGVNYSEVRQYQTDVHLIRFYFVTRCYNDYVESILEDLKLEPHPDIVIMNSCLWDITRYGKESIIDYKNNLVSLFDSLHKVLPSDCLMIWNATLPISNKARGGFLIPEIHFRTTTLRLDILEANFYAQSVIVERGFDILDLHFYLRHHLDKRVRDGIHWDMMAHRYITNLLLSHISKAFSSSITGSQHGFAPLCNYPKQTQYYDGDVPAENHFNNPDCMSSSLQQLIRDQGRHLLQINFDNVDCMPMVGQMQQFANGSKKAGSAVMEKDYNNNPLCNSTPKGPKKKTKKRQPGSNLNNGIEKFVSSCKSMLGSTFNAIQSCMENFPEKSRRLDEWQTQSCQSWNRPQNFNQVHERDPYRSLSRAPAQSFRSWDMQSQPYHDRNRTNANITFNCNQLRTYNGLETSHFYFGQNSLPPSNHSNWDRTNKNTFVNNNRMRTYNGPGGTGSFTPYQQHDFQGASHCRKRSRYRPYRQNY